MIKLENIKKIFNKNQNKGLVVLSLFDGISCGQLALERAGIPIDVYYASEIDKYAIQITQKNYPNTIQLGDVTKWGEWQIDFSEIDLVIGGSPCQGFSLAGKQLNFEDPRSKLFFEYAEILNRIKVLNPNVKFLLENVKMKQEYQDIISKYLGVEPIELNSALVSAQNRKRLYWTNIKGVTSPKDKGILLKDVVLENDVKCCKFNRQTGIGDEIKKSLALCAGDNRGLNRNQNQNAIIQYLSKYIVPYDKTLQILDKEVQQGKIKYYGIDKRNRRVYSIHDSQYTLMKNGNDPTQNKVLACITPDRVEKRQNGQRFNNGLKFYTLTAQDKHGVFIEGYIRHLTPIECERLQTLPDNYTQGVSDTQRYKQLGNGWTADIIAHIFKGLRG